MTLRCVLDARSLTGEGCLWDPVQQRLWWLDIKGRRIHRFDPGSGDNTTWDTPDDIGSLAVRASGGLIVAMGRGFYHFDPVTGGFALLGAPESHLPENRFNDGKPDRQGRFWAGSLHDAETRAAGTLYRLDPDLTWHATVDGVTSSNGLAFSPESDVVYFADSRRRIVWAFDLDAAEGRISNRRVFLELSQAEGAPDGAAVDADGCYWLAQPDAWRVVRYTPAGYADFALEMPVQRPTCVAFGGADLKTLFVTTFRWGLTAAQIAEQPFAGRLFAVEVATPGLPDAAFAG